MKKLFLLSAVFCLVTSTGYCQDQSQQPAQQSDQTPSIQPFIQSDKEVYEEGDQVKAKLIYGGKIYGLSGFFIQKWENNSWVYVGTRENSHIRDCNDIDFNKVEACPLYPSLSPPCWHEVEDEWRTMTWNQFSKAGERTFRCAGWGNEIRNDRCGVFKRVPGKYKIGFVYLTKLPQDVGNTRKADEKYVEKEILIK